ncbi:hypothetical protein D3C71_1802450 [compost metagenome]
MQIRDCFACERQDGDDDADKVEDAREGRFVRGCHVDRQNKNEGGESLDLQKDEEPPRGVFAPFFDEFCITGILACSPGSGPDMATQPQCPGRYHHQNCNAPLGISIGEERREDPTYTDSK